MACKGLPLQAISAGPALWTCCNLGACLCHAGRQDQGQAASVHHHSQAWYWEGADLLGLRFPVRMDHLQGWRDEEERGVLQRMEGGGAGFPTDAGLLHGTECTICYTPGQRVGAPRTEVDGRVPSSWWLCRLWRGQEGLLGSKVLLTTGEHEYTRYGYRQPREQVCWHSATWHHLAGRDHRSQKSGHGCITWHSGYTTWFQCVLLSPSVCLCQLPPCWVHKPQSQSWPDCPTLWRALPWWTLAKGWIHDLPDRPGFGVTLNEKMLLKRPYCRSDLESWSRQRKTSQDLSLRKHRCPLEYFLC